MEKAYKFRIYPNRTQEILIQKTFGCVRFVYNYFLDKRIKAYEADKTTLTYSKCSGELTKLKQELVWLKEPDKCSLQNALKQLDAAYQNFFQRIEAGYPKFKSKKNRHKSYKTNRTNKNFVRTDKYVGIDLGIKDFAITSDGYKYSNHKYLKQSLTKLAHLQRELSRKTKGGSNWEKARIKVARWQEKIANQRKDKLNKLSSAIVKSYDVICLEDLQVKNMVKNHTLAQSISDASWSEFTRQLSHKAKWHGKEVVKIDKFFPSSQTCHVCGHRNKGTKHLGVRTWLCPNCHTEHDRDINAAVNILHEGLRILKIA